MGYIDETARRAEEQGEEMSIVDTLQSLLIAFILAFTFRGFVVEAFVIPTGSMAPTLLGAHAVVRSPETGYVYPIGPSDEDSSDRGQAGPVLGGVTPYEITDPMLMSNRADEITVSNRRTRMGDRILVLKYLYCFFEPRRFDVVVFKNPRDPTQNYIKRLIGLAGDTIWLADGDVFAGPTNSTWQDADKFAIQRKPEDVQRAVWQPVYHSEYIPIDPSRVRGGWLPPWSGEGWEVAGRRSYRADSPNPTALVYQAPARAVNDRNAYNESREDEARKRGRPVYVYDVSDIRLAAAVKPDAGGLDTTIHLECRDHEFEAVLEENSVQLRMRLLGGDHEWTVLDSGSLSTFAPAGKVTDIEFWHADQALWLWINGSRVAYGTYDWNPSERLKWATGLSGEDAAKSDSGNQYVGTANSPKPLRLEWRFRNSAVTLHRVELDRDLYYRPEQTVEGPALATHPTNLVHLNENQFFCCGDNSPASLDGRLWGEPQDWIAQEVDPAPGVVNRKLLLGKAFFVYFPSPEGLREGARRFVPNFGSMRFIH